MNSRHTAIALAIIVAACLSVAPPVLLAGSFSSAPAAGGGSGGPETDPVAYPVATNAQQIAGDAYTAGTNAMTNAVSAAELAQQGYNAGTNAQRIAGDAYDAGTNAQDTAATAYIAGTNALAQAEASYTEATNAAAQASIALAGLGAKVGTNATFDALAIRNGSTLTNLNASNLASGTLPTARLPSGVVTNAAYIFVGDATKLSARIVQQPTTFLDAGALSPWVRVQRLTNSLLCIAIDPTYFFGGADQICSTGKVIRIKGCSIGELDKMFPVLTNGTSGANNVPFPGVVSGDHYLICADRGMQGVLGATNAATKGDVFVVTPLATLSSTGYLTYGVQGQASFKSAWSYAGNAEASTWNDDQTSFAYQGEDTVTLFGTNYWNSNMATLSQEWGIFSTTSGSGKNYLFHSRIADLAGTPISNWILLWDLLFIDDFGGLVLFPNPATLSW